MHKRLKIIHLIFQKMELTSVHDNSGQLFQRSFAVHVISVQEVHCFIASEKKNITSERRTKLTHRNILSMLATSLLYKTGATLAAHVRILTGFTKHNCIGSCLF